MKSFKQYITEAKFGQISRDASGRDRMTEIRGLDNPIADTLLQYLKNSSHKAVRFIVFPNGKMIVWNSNDALHSWVQRAEGISGDVCLGEIRIQGGKLIVKHGKRRGAYAKKNKALMSIKKTENPKWHTTGSLE